MCLINYMPVVVDLLEGQIEAWLLRRDFIANLIVEFGSALEYDSHKFSNITLSANAENCLFLLNVSVSPNYPTEQPQLTAYSIEHHRPGPQPLQLTFTGYPYSPRWPPKEMASRIRKFVGEKLSDIKRRFEEDHRKLSGQSVSGI
jgi:hypothetical protein